MTSGIVLWHSRKYLTFTVVSYLGCCLLEYCSLLQLIFIAWPIAFVVRKSEDGCAQPRDRYFTTFYTEDRWYFTCYSALDRVFEPWRNPHLAIYWCVTALPTWWFSKAATSAEMPELAPCSISLLSKNLNTLTKSSSFSSHSLNKFLMSAGLDYTVPKTLTCYGIVNGTQIFWSWSYREAHRQRNSNDEG